MPRESNISDKQIITRFRRLLERNSDPSWEEIANATRMSVGGIQYRLLKLGISKDTIWRGLPDIDETNKKAVA